MHLTQSKRVGTLSLGKAEVEHLQTVLPLIGM